MQVTMGIVGQPNTTITMFNTHNETNTIESQIDIRQPKNPQHVKNKMGFERARQRLVRSGAAGCKFFPVTPN